MRLLAYLVKMLDCALTGKTWREVGHSMRSQGIQRFIDGEEYYLSDGGYSRIVFGNSGSVFLTSNSLDEARVAWKRSPELVQDVQDECLRLREEEV
jgi:hypothetical protein